MKRWLGRLAAVMAVAYVLLCAAFWLIQDDLFFHPGSRPLAECNLPDGVETVEFDGERALFTPSRGEGLFIFYHGNAGSACGWRFLGPNHVAHFGYDTLVVEYPGYAGDARGVSGRAFRPLVERVARWAEGYDRVIIAGFSLGSGVASLHAAHTPPDGVLLFAPFRDFVNLVRSNGGLFPRFLFRTDFDNLALLREGGAPVTVVYGDRDRVIPAEVSAGLAEALGAQTAGTLSVPGAGHNTLIGAIDLEQVLNVVIGVR